MDLQDAIIDLQQYVEDEKNRMEGGEAGCYTDEDRDEIAAKLERVRELETIVGALLDSASWVVRLSGTDDPEGIKELRQKVRELRETIIKAKGE